MRRDGAYFTTMEQRAAGGNPATDYRREAMSEESHYDQLMKNPEFAKAMVKEGATLEREIAAEELKQMEARAVAAEMAMQQFEADFKTGEMSTLQVATRMLERIGNLDLTAAREMIAKAEEADTLRRQLQASEALRGKLWVALRAIWNVSYPPREGDSISVGEYCKADEQARATFTLTPTAALADYRRELLEEVAKLADAKSAECTLEARRQHEGNCPIMGRRFENMAHDYAKFAAEIRAMGGGE